MGEQAERMTRLIDDLLSLCAWRCASTCRPPSASISTSGGARHPEPAADRRPDRHHDRVPPAGGAGRSCAATATRSCRCSRTWCRTPSSTASEAGASRLRVAREPAGGGLACALRRSRDRRRARHRAPASAPPHRALLPRQRGGEPGEGRHRPRARHRQAHPQPPSRRARSTSKVGHGSTFALACPAQD